MNAITDSVLNDLRAIVGEAQVIHDPKLLGYWSRDHYWFSPVLKPLLDDKNAEVIVQPRSMAALEGVSAYAATHRIPLTLKGAGTGNYGQGVPMRGGILLDTKALTDIIEVNASRVRAQAGAKLIDLERAARAVGAEMRFYPSTLMTATAAGFLAGGSGGIGSVTWGTLWDDDNVLGATIVTVEEQPRTIDVRDAETLLGVIHSCGLTGIIADLSLATAPARPWEEATLTFPDFEDALRFGEEFSNDDGVEKRLVSVLEWPIPASFKSLIRTGAVQEGKALVLLETTVPKAALEARAAALRGTLTHHVGHERYHKGGQMLSDFSWNHSTLWAMRMDANITYLQDQFSPERLHEQHRARKARYGDDVVTHIEFMKWRGRVVPQGLSLTRLKTRDALWELMAFCESIGIWIANPHTHRLDEDARWNGQPILDAKQRWDPHGLLNPGHLKALED